MSTDFGNVIFISVKMSVKSFVSRDSSEVTSNRSEADSSEAGDSAEDDESNFVLVEIPPSDTKTFCKLCFRTAQVSK